jgi:hypothetical protein
VLDVLVQWQLSSTAATLPPYDATLLRRELDLFPEWFIGRHLGVELSDDEKLMLDRTFKFLINSALAQPKVFVHRDFMPRNLMVVESEERLTPGIIDFQDAVYGPITYDVVSLFRDAFISWDEEQEIDWVVRYWEKARAAGLPVREDFGDFWRDYELMGLQRHLKVLGIFCRLKYRDGKDKIQRRPAALHELRPQDAARYVQLKPLLNLLDKLEGKTEQIGYRSLNESLHPRRRPRRTHAAADRPHAQALLVAGGKPLIVWHLERLAAAGFREIVINHAHLGADRANARRRSQWGLHIQYSPEPPGALETAGGIATALPLLGDEPFLVVNGDVYCDFDFGRFFGATVAFAHLVMVANPAHHTGGDFSLDGERVIYANGEQTLTYAGIGVFSPAFFADVNPGTIMKLRPLLDAAIAAGTLTGERFTGRWVDVGTPQRLA